MTSARFLVRVLFAVCLASSTVGPAARTALADDAKCTVATKGGSAPAKACARGGRPEARKTMKEMVAVAKANGQKFTCDGCHKDLDSYALTPNAREDFRKLETAQKK